MAKTLIDGMDISLLDEIGILDDVTDEDDSQVLERLKLMKKNGVNAVRLRIWNKPAGGIRNLERTLQMAKMIKAFDMQLLLAFHYSDNWACPVNHGMPKGRVHLGREALNDQVFNYTYYVLSELKEQGTLPDQIQFGNETTSGTHWCEGKVNGEFDTDVHMDHYMNLVIAGVVAAKSVDSAINIRLGVGGEY